MAAKFVLKKGSTGKFRFNLVATNGHVQGARIGPIPDRLTCDSTEFQGGPMWLPPRE